MTKRIIAIAFIFVCASIAWAILGGTIFSRTYLDRRRRLESGRLHVGEQQNQAPPSASFKQTVTRKEERTENGKKIVDTIKEEVATPLPLESSAVDVGLDLEHRQKGLLWYSTYKVDFAGSYGFRNTSDKEQLVTFVLNFPTAKAIYDDLVFTVDGTPVATSNEANAASGSVKIPAGQVTRLAVGYQSQGLNEWRYSFGSGEVAQVRDFSLKMKTNFKDIDFPDNTLSPSEKHETGNGWELAWSYKNLVSGYQIAMVMPEKLQPGPLAGRHKFFAPVSLFLFLLYHAHHHYDARHRASSDELLLPRGGFFRLPSAARLSGGSRLNPRCLCHLSGRVSLPGRKLPASGYRASLCQSRSGARAICLPGDVLLCLLLKGFTGLAITLGSVVTLFVAMQVTGTRALGRQVFPETRQTAGRLS